MLQELSTDKRQMSRLETAWHDTPLRQAYLNGAETVHRLQLDLESGNNNVFMPDVNEAAQNFGRCREDYAADLRGMYESVKGKFSGPARKLEAFPEDMGIQDIFQAKEQPEVVVLDEKTATIEGVYLPAWGPRMIIDPEALANSPEILIRTGDGETYLLKLSEAQIREITEADPEYLIGSWIKLEADPGVEVNMQLMGSDMQPKGSKKGEIKGALFVDVAGAWELDGKLFIRGRLMEGTDVQNLNAPTDMAVILMNQPGLRYIIMPNSQLPGEQMEQGV